LGAPGGKVLNGRVRAAAWPGSERSARAPRWIRRLLVLGALLGIVAVLLPWGVSGLGQWLLVADPLEPAKAIVVLSGRVPFRAMEAASIYREGLAPEVWLTKEVVRAEELALGRLGVAVVRDEVYNRQALERLGVKPEAIRLLDDGVWNTVDEVRLIARELARNGGDRVIVVTSKAHSRRVRATWAAIVGISPRAIVRYARDEPYGGRGWWRNTRDALDVSREVFGLMNVWAGFPVQPDRHPS
jgi:uncharacterized SAM-binding protein YcdF (DUF218 family)